MDRAFSSGASGTPPSAPGSPSTGYATSGNPGTATPATKPGAYWYHMVTEELRALIVAAGLTPDHTNTSQIAQAVQALIAAGAANDYKASVRAATTANIASLAGGAPNTLDGVTLVANNRILVKDQTTGSQNGIYYVSTLGTGANGTWTRETDADGAGELTSGAIVAVEEGTANIDSMWMLITDGAITIGTTSLTFVRKDITNAIAVPVRQTVLAAPVDTSGLPTFLPATAGSLTLAMQNVTSGTPLVVAAANGFGSTGAVDRVGIATTNLSCGLAASAINYLYVDIAANGSMTFGATQLAPIYQQGGTPSVASVQFTFNIQEMKAYVGNGSTAPQAYRVFIGEAVTNASTVTSTVAYALMGRYDSGLYSIAVLTDYSKNHNLGVGNYSLTVNFSDDAAGTNERAAMPLTYTSTNIGWYAKTSTPKSVTVSTSTALNHNTSGSTTTVGFYRVKTTRGW